jgi:hypothetical protein
MQMLIVSKAIHPKKQSKKQGKKCSEDAKNDRLHKQNDFGAIRILFIGFHLKKKFWG